MKQGQPRSLFGWRMAKGEQREERRRNGGERQGATRIDVKRDPYSWKSQIHLIQLIRITLGLKDNPRIS